MEAVRRTTGSILELGCGLYSTNPLHWACFVPKRRLVTYENNPQFYNFLKRYETDCHEIHCITDWDAIDISEPWSVAFIDHEPGHRRGIELARVTHAEYVVCHDTEPRRERKYGWNKSAGLYRYSFTYTEAYPHTTIFSNVHDVTDFLCTNTAST